MLKAVPMSRTDGIVASGGSNTSRVTFDFEVDGVSLAKLLGIERYDLVGRFDTVHPEWNEHPRMVFLLRAAPDLGNGRVLLFVCPECGDIGCGAITIAVRREGNDYEWSDFRYENGYDEQMTREFLGVGPFRFCVSEYKRLLQSLGEQSGV
jgi:hypothetical protein